MTAALLVLVVLLALVLWRTWRQLVLHRAMRGLALATVDRRTHERDRARRALADMEWSRDQALLDNAALRGEWEVAS